MKIVYKKQVLLWVILFTTSFVFGQIHGQQKNAQLPFKGLNTNLSQKYLQESGFRLGLNWYQYTGNHYREKAQNTFQYRIDTALVYSNSVNPQRYINFYDSADNKISSLVELMSNGKWEYVSKDTATYDSVGNQMSLLAKVWDNGKWVNASLSVDTYAGNHNVITKVAKIWIDDNWIYTDSSHFDYDFNGNKVTDFHAVWSDSVWVSNSFILYSYDSVGNLKLSLSEQWQDSLWTNSTKLLYTYDSASNLIHGFVQSWGDTNWVNVYQESYKYDSARNRISYTGEIWNDSVWVNDQHYDYSYGDERRLVSGIGENWNDSTWVYYEKGQYTYDTYGGVESYLYQQWENDSAWEDISLLQYNYDTAGNAYLGNYYTMDSTGSWSQNNDGVLQIYYNYGSTIALYTGYQVEIKYNSPISTGVVEMKNFVSQYLCAPNPAIDHTAIHLGLDIRERISIYLYSLTGEKLATIFQGELNKGTYRFEVQTSQLPSGIYLASLLTGKYAKTIKIVVR
jgi:hypothetical protein